MYFELTYPHTSFLVTLPPLNVYFKTGLLALPPAPAKLSEPSHPLLGTPTLYLVPLFVSQHACVLQLCDNVCFKAHVLVFVCVPPPHDALLAPHSLYESAPSLVEPKDLTADLFPTLSTAIAHP